MVRMMTKVDVLKDAFRRSGARARLTQILLNALAHDGDFDPTDLTEREVPHAES